MGFKQYLDSLKLSSKDAIVDGEKDSLSDLKKYLHIERTVEKALSQLVLKAAISSTSQLILLLGNVGDGKSHLLAKMWEAHPDQLKNFRVYNDATESAFKNRSYLENLLEVFKPYSDDDLIKPSIPIKTIIAINLGTLTNFLEEAGEGFANLRQYVSINHLIEDKINHSIIEADPCFHTLALTDYHIFSLSPTGAFSKVLLDIIKRITQKTNENPFYTSYKEFYDTHPLFLMNTSKIYIYSMPVKKENYCLYIN